jgi:hypothetical protein
VPFFVVAIIFHVSITLGARSDVGCTFQYTLTRRGTCAERRLHLVRKAPRSRMLKFSRQARCPVLSRRLALIVAPPRSPLFIFEHAFKVCIAGDSQRPFASEPSRRGFAHRHSSSTPHMLRGTGAYPYVAFEHQNSSSWDVVYATVLEVYRRGMPVWQHTLHLSDFPISLPRD